MNTQSNSYHILTLTLRIALVLALAGVGWAIYRNLPGGGSLTNTEGDQPETVVSVVLRPLPDDAGAGFDISIKLYPIDITAAQREFFSERRPGARLEDYIEQRLNGREVVEGRLDRNGQATLMVPPGRWWIHATLAGTQTLEWRLPVNISGRQKTVELNADNAYARMKSF